MAKRSGRRDLIQAQLAELALGVLDPREREAVESQVEASTVLSAELAALRRTVAALDELVEPVSPSAALRERVLTSARRETRFEGFVTRMARLFDFSLEQARAVLAAIDDPETAWEAPGLPGVRLHHFQGGPAVAGADCGLVEVAPGVEFLPHCHHGGEWCLNLQGRALENSGEEFLPGDLVFRDEGSHHSFRSTGEEPYLFAVVLYGGFHPDDGTDPSD